MTGLLALALAAFSCGDPIVDARDGQRYPTVRIGDQCWTARNATAAGGTCYGNDPESCRRLRRALHVGRGAGQACPAGWHLPARGEWEALAAHLGTATAGEKLKARKDHVPPFDGTDEVGFTALPAGAAFRGAFGRQGDWGVFWTATENGPERAVSVTLDRLWHPEPPRYRKLVFDEAFLKENAFSVRCTSEIPAPSEIAGLTRSPRPGSAEPRVKPAERPSPELSEKDSQGQHVLATLVPAGASQERAVHRLRGHLAEARQLRRPGGPDPGPRPAGARRACASPACSRARACARRAGPR